MDIDNEREEQETGAKREEQAKQDRYQGVLDRFISEGHERLKAFSLSSRIDFNEKEAQSIYYGIMATATKSNVVLNSPQGEESAVDKFLASMDWIGCGNYRRISLGGSNGCAGQLTNWDGTKKLDWGLCLRRKDLVLLDNNIFFNSTQTTI